VVKKSTTNFSQGNRCSGGVSNRPPSKHLSKTLPVHQSYKNPCHVKTRVRHCVKLITSSFNPLKTKLICFI
jgi:hypothetical protein